MSDVPIHVADFQERYRGYVIGRLMTKREPEGYEVREFYAACGDHMPLYAPTLFKLRQLIDQLLGPAVS